jgi:hypothetical protein
MGDCLRPVRYDGEPTLPHEGHFTFAELIIPPDFASPFFLMQLSWM